MTNECGDIKFLQYSLFIEEIRMNQKKGFSLKEAVEAAADSCIQKGILADMLLGNKAEGIAFRFF